MSKSMNIKTVYLVLEIVGAIFPCNGKRECVRDAWFEDRN